LLKEWILTDGNKKAKICTNARLVYEKYFTIEESVKKMVQVFNQN